MIVWATNHIDLFQYPNKNTLISKIGSKQKSSGGVLFQFDSKWILVESDKQKVAPGYVLSSLDGKRLIIYHEWGE